MRRCRPAPRRDNFDFEAYLHEAVGAEFEVEFEHIGFWDLRFAIADRYRAGRVFIAGDAAHSHPPYGGYGVNSGLEDARNLGWKLAATLQGWGGEALLDSYDAERRPVFASTIARLHRQRPSTTTATSWQTFDPARDRAAFEAAWQARAQGAVGEVHAFEPNYEGSPVVCGSGDGPRRSAHGLAPLRGARRATTWRRPRWRTGATSTRRSAPASRCWPSTHPTKP